MATLTPQSIALAGTSVTFAAAGGSGDKVKAGPGVELEVKNASGGSINVTVATPGTDRFGSAIADIVVAVADGAHKRIKLSDPALNDPSDKLVHVTYSATSSVTVAATRH